MEVHSLSKQLPKEWNPAGYGDLVRDFFREAPKDVDGTFNASAAFYRLELLRKIFSTYEITGSPEFWDYDYMMTTLFVDGHFTVTDTELGVIPLQCGITGINVWNHPTEVIVANPVLGGFNRKIGEDCALVKLQFDYRGVMDLVNRYAVNLAMCDSSIAVNLMNTKAAIIAQAESPQQAKTFKKMYDEISSGKPFVVVRKDLVKLGESIIFSPVKQAYIADDVMILKRQIMNEFLTMIGLENANTDKRERLISDEVNANNAESEIAANHWIDTVNEGLREANRMYSLSLNFKKREPEGGDNESEQSDPVLSGDED